MHPIVGTWDVTTTSVFGETRAVYSFSEQGGQVVAVVEDDPSEPTLSDITTVGNTVHTTISVKKPVPLTLRIDLVIDGDRFTGEIHTRFLPDAHVVGIRRG